MLSKHEMFWHLIQILSEEEEMLLINRRNNVKNFDVIV